MPRRLINEMKVWGIHVLAAGVLIPILFPFYWLTVSALQDPAHLLQIPPRLVPKTVSSYYVKNVFGQLGFGRFVFNSVHLSLISTAVTVAMASLAAYSYVAYSYRVQRTVSAVVLFVYMFPPILVVIPLYLMLTRMGLINTRTGVVLTYVAFNLPVGIWVLQAYFATIPKSLMEAGLIDGLSKFRALWRIYLPLCSPGLAAVAIMTFIGVWNDFLFANTFLIAEQLRPLAVVIVDYSTREGAMLGEILASSLIAAVPSFCFALFAQRHLVGGLTAGATKM